MLYVKYMKLQTSRQKNGIIEKTELAGTKNILNRSNMELSRLTHICYKKILLLHLSTVIQYNLLFGFLYNRTHLLT